MANAKKLKKITDADLFLSKFRLEIDALDEQLLCLLNRRAACSVQIGAVKAEAGDSVFCLDREQKLLTRLCNANKGPLPKEHLLAIYREVLSSSRALQRPSTVVFLGPEGTFSHMAGLQYFGSAVCFQPLGHLCDVFDAVSTCKSDFGIVPLENSLYGTVGQSIDLFVKYNVHIQAEWLSKIDLCLLGHGDMWRDVQVVYSHAQPLGQCAEWLRRNLPQARLEPMESTAAAAYEVVNNKKAAAIGHALLAGRLGLRILADGIEDAKDNWTRFCAIGSKAAKNPDADKTTVLFSLADAPGTLARVLQCFAEAGINLSKLESRPLRAELWKYLFIADLGVALTETQYELTMQNVQKLCDSFRILGIYSTGQSFY